MYKHNGIKQIDNGRKFRSEDVERNSTQQLASFSLAKTTSYTLYS